MDFGKNWGGNDTALLLAALSGVYADMYSTKEAVKRGAVEANPLIGRNPSGQDLDKIGLLGAGLAGAAGAFAPSEDRKMLLGALAGLRFGAANQNAHTSSGGESKSTLDLMKQPLTGAALGALAGYLLNTPDTSLTVAPDRIGVTKTF